MGRGLPSLGGRPYKYGLRAQANSTCKIISGLGGISLKFAEGSVRIVLLVPVGTVSLSTNPVVTYLLSLRNEHCPSFKRLSIVAMRFPPT